MISDSSLTPGGAAASAVASYAGAAASRSVRAVRATSDEGVPYIGFALVIDGDQAVLERVLRAFGPARLPEPR